MKFDPEKAEAILARLMNGESLKRICEDADMPHRQRVYEWLAQEPAFADNYARALEIRADHHFDEMLEIADSPANLASDELNAAKLKIEARKWVLGRMMPKKYGDKLGLEHSGGLTVNVIDSFGRDT
jgi:hypothetical protein